MAQHEARYIGRMGWMWLCFRCKTLPPVPRSNCNCAPIVAAVSRWAVLLSALRHFMWSMKKGSTALSSNPPAINSGIRCFWLWRRQTPKAKEELCRPDWCAACNWANVLPWHNAAICHLDVFRENRPQMEALSLLFLDFSPHDFSEASTIDVEKMWLDYLRSRRI